MDRVEIGIIATTIIAILLILIMTAGLFFSGCQQVPYKDIITYVDPKQPECAYIIDDGFDQICVVIIIETRVEIRKVEVPGDTVYIEVPKEVVREVIRTVEVPGETVYIIMPGETIYVEVPVTQIVEVPGETVYIEVPTEKIVEVERIVKVERIVYLPKIYHITISIPPSVMESVEDFEQDGMSGTVEIKDDMVKVSTPEMDVYVPVEEEVEVEIPVMEENTSPDTNRNGLYCVTLAADGRSSGVTHSDYLIINGLEVTWTGDDGKQDPHDVTRTVKKVECGYTYEQASERARSILSE